jgi:hypothetical protein
MKILKNKVLKFNILYVNKKKIFLTLYKKFNINKL